jgi:2-oxoglutarate dehydrogenase E1 component
MGFETTRSRTPKLGARQLAFGETDDLTGALDPTQMAVEVKAAAKGRGQADATGRCVAAAAIRSAR